ncbi:MAG: DUF2239 family protein [Terracidiphilus sp.]
MSEIASYTAFSDQNILASGELDGVLAALKSHFDLGSAATILVFQDQTGRQVDFDLRGTLEEVVARAQPAPARSGPGRPRLGVIGREISLLPRHWEWLEEQPNGASAALRRLVDQARAQEQGSGRVRLALEAAGRFMTAMAGNLPDYEEATRALYAKNRSRLEALIAPWPQDIRGYVLRLAGDCI